jgi:hypothetical protein
VKSAYRKFALFVHPESEEKAHTYVKACSRSLLVGALCLSMSMMANDNDNKAEKKDAKKEAEADKS